ncbi:MAG: 50S ribosomal protein L21e, partial [Candidatus Diapherotrites archaeon]|nr:50S ribosomal protein L21e [Candidatus Diapherotrites archaeon]
LAEIKLGKRVAIKIEPSIHKGMPFRRFHGLTGVVVGKQGEAYKVKIKDGKKEKELIVGAAHLKELE